VLTSKEHGARVRAGALDKMTSEQRRSRARLAALTQWSREPDPTGRTATARAAFMARFEAEVDPAGVFPPEIRARMAEQARRAYFIRLGRASGKARAARKAGEGP
jgi:hypothetical protein